jgi:serine/threonine-protein kinase
LLNEIGRGSHGTVYCAWDTRLEREVALKVLADADDGRSNIEEARRLARVSHRHVVSVYGADRIDGHVGIWMELLKGRTLDAMVREQGPFSVREAIVIAVDICGAVAAIHRAGLIHRDLKAQNVMREPGGRLVVMDVGASVTIDDYDATSTSLAGTPLYMAPELFDRARPSVTSDVYAIGVMLYRLVTAEFPIEARTLGDVRRAHAEARLRPLRSVRPDLPAGFVRLVERCLAPDAAARFQSVAALEQALQEVDRRMSAPRPGRWSRLALPAAGTVAILAAAAGAAIGWAYAQRNVDENASTASPGLRINPQQYTLLAGYEELAFGKRFEDPKAAAAATRGAFAQIRQTLPGQHGVFALLYARLAECARRAGDLAQARRETLDGAAHVIGSIGEDHPYAAVLAMESARNAQAAGDHQTAAAEILRALEIRWRVLGLADLGLRHGPLLEVARLESYSRSGSPLEDTDGDGLPDVIESAAGLDARSIDSNRDGVLDQDEDHDRDGVNNRLALGLIGDPFLTWAHFGAHAPRLLAWQVPAQFPAVERPDPGSRPPAWSVTASHSMTFFSQRLAASHSSRAMDRGFSILVRAQPVEGITAINIDAAPVGVRFDLLLRRIDQRSIEVRLPSSIVPRQGPTAIIDAPADGRWVLFELRFDPREKSATLFADGRRLLSGYAGHSQYQDPRLGEGALSWGCMLAGDGDTRAAARFSLIWLEIR